MLSDDERAARTEVEAWLTAQPETPTFLVSTLFTMDFYQQHRPNATQHQLVWIGRVATTVMVLIARFWIPVIQGARGLYDYLQGVQGYLAPAIFTVFFLGVFNKRLNTKGCLAALGVGFVLGVFRLAVDTPVALKMAGYEQGYPAGSSSGSSTTSTSSTTARSSSWCACS